MHHWRTALICIVSLIWFLGMLTKPVNANSRVIFTDNFDDGTASDWTVQRSYQYHFPTLPCMFESEPALWKVLDGRLGIDIYGSSCTTEITPNHLDMTSVTSFEYEFDWYFPDSMNMDRNVIFVWQDGRNWYGLKINQNTMFVQKVVNGASHAFENDAINYPFAINRRYHFKVTFNADHTIQVDIDGQRVWSSVDYKPYITGFKTLGLQASVGGAPYSRSYFDNLVVRDTSSPEKLSVPLLKQTDPAWTDIVYDSAQNWASNTGIGRWGCAITSLTMIMQYHGLVQMPDGTPVTPAAINAWLNSQSDGYIGEGLVNWVATTRLTRLISEQYGTPKLEYARRNTAELTSTYEQIAMGLPVMLQIPGHFIVATGAQQDPQDLFINDPAYSYTKLSQHAQQPISARFFTPSHTDLSYLLIHHALELQLEITFPDSNQFDNAYAEYIKDQTEGATEQTKIVSIHEVEKPIDGKYTLTLSQPTFGPYEVSILTYDQQGNPTFLNQSGWIGPTPTTFELHYADQGTSTISRISSFGQFRQQLLMLRKNAQVAKYESWHRLDRLAEFGMTGSLQTRTRLKQVLASNILNNPSLTTGAQQLLMAELNAL